VRPWWADEAGSFDEAPPLEGDLRVDVAVVGGGYTGLWTALALREREPSLEIVVLEATVCGDGPSGRNGGFLHGYWSSLARLRETFGDGGALAVAQASSRIVLAVREWCDQHGADVWLREGGLMKVATAPAQDDAVERTVAAARELGVEEEAVPLSREEVAARCDSPVFRRGVFFRDGATVQPARLVLALRREAMASVACHERTPVLRLLRGTPNVLLTPRGRVTADEVVLGVNAATTGWRPTARSLTNFGSYVVLTEPAPERLEEIGWLGDEAIVDGRMFLHYFRTTNDGRVLMGSGSGPIGFAGLVDRRFTGDTATAARAERGLRRLLPQLADVRIERAWGGPIDVSADHFPFFATVPGSRVHYGAGYSGNGVGPSWLGGQILASLALRGEDEWTGLPLARCNTKSLPPEPLKRLGGGVVRASILAVEEAEEEGRRPPVLARAGAALPRLVGLRLGTR
jgi:glycine/D-amino acid oxidase-like deaminating enzyme